MISAKAELTSSALESWKKDPGTSSLTHSTKPSSRGRGSPRWRAAAVAVALEPDALHRGRLSELIFRSAAGVERFDDSCNRADDTWRRERLSKYGFKENSVEFAFLDHEEFTSSAGCVKVGSPAHGRAIERLSDDRISSRRTSKGFPRAQRTYKTLSGSDLLQNSP